METDDAGPYPIRDADHVRPRVQAGGPLEARVLIVDDDARNRVLLRDMLENAGCETFEAADGPGALEVVAARKPDVVLLDVMMPGMDGFEVCRRMRESPETASIPVVMITALQEREHRLRGIAAGANDYLTKPIDRDEVLLRVRNAAFARRLLDQAQRDVVRLKELETLRDTLMHLIVHDMRSPLHVILMGVGVMRNDESRLRPEQKRAMETIQIVTLQLNEMVTAILDVSRFEAGQMPVKRVRCDMKTIVASALQSVQPLLCALRVETVSPEGPVTVCCDQGLMERVIVNLSVNAANFMPEGGDLRILIDVAEETVRVSVSDTGPGIAPEHHGKIFEKFGQVESRRQHRKHSTGLGLAFCRLAVEAHGGRIGVESDVGKGSTFWFDLPRDAEEQAPPAP
jgi:two-component system, sensor histidine kinase and response regulator